LSDSLKSPHKTVSIWVNEDDRRTMKLKEELVYAAIDGFTAQRLRIDSQIAELRAMLNGSSTGIAATPEPAPRRGRKMSAAARRRIAIAQKVRWEKVRGGSEPGPSKVKAPKRKLSAAGRRAIVEALKRRWALKRLEAGKAKKAAPARKKVVKRAAA
jgi:hypothetical protein